MTDVMKTAVELERGKTPTKQPADNCDHIEQYNNTEIAIPPLRVTVAQGDVCVCFNRPRPFEKKRLVRVLLSSFNECGNFCVSAKQSG